MNNFLNDNLKEEQILNAFISKLPEGIMICNSLGMIRLCNQQALQYLVQASQYIDSEHNVIGDHIFDYMDKNLIEHALDEINEWLKQNIRDMVSNFTFQKNNLTLHTQIIPVLNSKGLFSGFVMIFENITQQARAEKRVESFLQVLSKNARSPLASIRAAIEAMRQFPGMEPDKQHQFKEIIYNESIILSDMLSQASNTHASLIKTKKSLKPVSCRELFDTIARRALGKQGILLEMSADTTDDGLSIKADQYSLVMGVLFVLTCLKNETRLKIFHYRFSVENKIVFIDIQWQGDPVKPEVIKQWEIQEMIVDTVKANITLKDVLSHHHGALWAYVDEKTLDSMPYLRFFIPAEENKESVDIAPIPILPETRTQLSDLELFDDAALNPELDDRLLTELSYTSLIREINQATAIEGVIGKHSQLPRLINSMITSGTKIRTVTWLVTAFSDAILNKIIEFALREQGPYPVPFAFITLGSEGRKEQSLKTDQDNAIVFMDPETKEGEKRAQEYFLKLGEKICMWLDQAGYDYCKGGIMAKNPKWCQPLSVWKTYFLKWTRTTEPDNLMHSSIFFDFRQVFGDKSIIDSLSQHLYEALEENRLYFQGMAKNAMQFKPPIGFFNNLRTESKGEHKKCFDIKKANTPIVDIARVYSLYHKIRQTNTQDRIHQLYLKRVFTRDEYNEIEQAYSFMMQIRFIGQIKAIVSDNFKPNNFINPKHLSSIERKMLKEILKLIKSLQKKICYDFTGSSDG